MQVITLGICAEMTRGANMVWAADESRVHVLFFFGPWRKAEWHSDILTAWRWGCGIFEVTAKKKKKQDIKAEKVNTVDKTNDLKRRRRKRTGLAENNNNNNRVERSSTHYGESLLRDRNQTNILFKIILPTWL